MALAVAQAWQNFRDGKIALAERAIGQISDAEIFVVSPGRTHATRWLRIYVGGFMGMSSLLLAAGWLFSERLSGMKPVNLTETQVRAFLNDVKPNPKPDSWSQSAKLSLQPSYGVI